MDIVDSQVHLFMTIGSDEGRAAMDALGIAAALIDESWGYTAEGIGRNGFRLPNGIMRRIHPGAEMSSFKHPDRFAYLVKVNRGDPALDALVSMAKESPHCKAIRVDIRADEELRALANGEYQSFFEVLQKYQLPLFVLMAPDQAPLLRKSFEQFPNLRFVLDHCGMASSRQTFPAVLELAKGSNVYLKWCHAPSRLSKADYPFPDAIEELRRSIDAFGRERILWASDFTAIYTGYTWAQSLFYVLDSASLSTADKEWILGRTTRTLLQWPPVAAAENVN